MGEDEDSEAEAHYVSSSTKEDRGGAEGTVGEGEEGGVSYCLCCIVRDAFPVYSHLDSPRRSWVSAVLPRFGTLPSRPPPLAVSAGIFTSNPRYSFLSLTHVASGEP